MQPVRTGPSQRALVVLAVLVSLPTLVSSAHADDFAAPDANACRFVGEVERPVPLRASLAGPLVVEAPAGTALELSVPVGRGEQGLRVRFEAAGWSFDAVALKEDVALYLQTPRAFKGFVAPSGTTALHIEAGLRDRLQISFELDQGIDDEADIDPLSTTARRVAGEIACSQLALTTTLYDPRRAFGLRKPLAFGTAKAAEEDSRVGLSTWPGGPPVAQLGLLAFSEPTPIYRRSGAHAFVALRRLESTLVGWVPTRIFENISAPTQELLDDALGDPNAPTTPWGEPFALNDRTTFHAPSMLRCDHPVPAFATSVAEPNRIATISPAVLFAEVGRNALGVSVRPLLNPVEVVDSIVVAAADVARCRRLPARSIRREQPSTQAWISLATATSNVDGPRAILEDLAQGKIQSALQRLATFVRQTRSSQPELAAEVLLLGVRHLALHNRHHDVVRLLETDWLTPRQPALFATWLRGRESLARSQLALGNVTAAENAYQAIISEAADPYRNIAMGLNDAQLADTADALGSAYYFFAERTRARAESVKFPVFEGERQRQRVLDFIMGSVKTWYEARVALVHEAAAEYGKILDIQPYSPTRWSIPASARVGRLWGDLVSDLDRCPWPLSEPSPSLN